MKFMRDYTFKPRRSIKNELRCILILLFLIILFTSNSNAQVNNNFRLNITVGQNFMLQNTKDRGAQFDGEIFNSMEFRYVHYINDRFRRGKQVWGIESGLTYSINEFFSIYEDVIANETITIIEKVNLIYLPINLRYHFNKTYFLSSGIIYTFEIPSQQELRRSEQNGLGLNIEFGAEFKLTKTLKASISAVAVQHNLLSFSSSEFNDAVSEIGVKFGMSYQFK
jgi:hypothetical protein